MIAYRELDEDDDPPKIDKKPIPVAAPIAPSPKQTFIEKSSALFKGETSECNYLVMAFVFGVLALAITDSIRR